MWGGSRRHEEAEVSFSQGGPGRRRAGGRRREARLELAVHAPLRRPRTRRLGSDAHAAPNNTKQASLASPGAALSLARRGLRSPHACTAVAPSHAARLSTSLVLCGGPPPRWRPPAASRCRGRWAAGFACLLYKWAMLRAAGCARSAMTTGAAGGAAARPRSLSCAVCRANRCAPSSRP